MAMDELSKALYDKSLSVLDQLKVACYLVKSPSNHGVILKWVCGVISSPDKRKSASEQKEMSYSLYQLLSVLLRAVSSEQWTPDDSVFNVHFFEVGIY